MMIRLSNLSARAPGREDLPAITRLLRSCDLAVYALTEINEDDIARRWLVPGFKLSSDAWTIVTKDDDIVGYADVHRKVDGLVVEFELFLRVHPDYRQRGIEVLLIWLLEERARQMMAPLPARMQVVLTIVWSHLEPAVLDLFVREGYLKKHSFWRLLLDLEEVVESSESSGQPGKLAVDLVVETTSLLGTASVRRRTGMYSAHQYDLYEKVLREGCFSCGDPENSVTISSLI